MTHLWLHPLAEPLSRRQQSARARELLAMMCTELDLRLSSAERSLKGEALLDVFSDRWGLWLSISHCPAAVAIALCEQPVGVDCEAPGKARDWCAIAEVFFSPTESEAIDRVGASQRETLFLRHWVLKEAYLKMQRGSVFGNLNDLVLEGPDRARLQGVPAATCCVLRSGSLQVALCAATEASLQMLSFPRLERCAAVRIPMTEIEHVEAYSAA